MLDDNVTPSPRAIRIGGDMTPGFINVINNTIFGWGDTTTIAVDGNPRAISISSNIGADPVVLLKNNVFIASTAIDDRIAGISSTFTNVTGTHNAFYTPLNSPSKALPPSDWTNSIVLNAATITINAPIAKIDFNSPLISVGLPDSSPSTSPAVDLYGIPRVDIDIGAFEYFSRPKEPTQLSID